MAGEAPRKRFPWRHPGPSSLPLLLSTLSPRHHGQPSPKPLPLPSAVPPLILATPTALLPPSSGLLEVLKSLHTQKPGALLQQQAQAG